MALSGAQSKRLLGGTSHCVGVAPGRPGRSCAGRGSGRLVSPGPRKMPPSSRGTSGKAQSRLWPRRAAVAKATSTQTPSRGREQGGHLPSMAGQRGRLRGASAHAQQRSHGGRRRSRGTAARAGALGAGARSAPPGGGGGGGAPRCATPRLRIRPSWARGARAGGGVREAEGAATPAGTRRFRGPPLACAGSGPRPPTGRRKSVRPAAAAEA